MGQQSKKGCILVTLRDRDVHRDVFLLYMQRYFSYIPIILIEQNDQSAWNKGLLYNVGYITAGYEYDYIILHDIDFIPARSVDYSYTPQPTLLSTQCSQFGYTQYYPTFFGGVVGISTEHYKLINGFSNEFRGYGGEDDNLRLRCINKGLIPENRPGNRFENFTHPRPDIRPGTSFYHTPDYQNNLRMCTTEPEYITGISDADYYITSDTQHRECRHIRVKTDI